jgi:hypothetical protein
MKQKTGKQTNTDPITFEFDSITKMKSCMPKGTKMKMDILYPMLDINTSISTIFNFSRLPQREMGTEANALDINLMK